MSRTTIDIPFLYPVDVAVRDAVRRVAVLGRTPPAAVRFDERRIRANVLRTDRGSDVSIRFLEDGGRHLSPQRLPFMVPAVHPGLQSVMHFLPELPGSDVFMARARHAGTIRILREDDLAGLEIVASHREAVLARASVFAQGLVETPGRGAGGTASGIDSDMRETVIGRDFGVKDETRGRSFVVETGHGWRVFDFAKFAASAVPSHPRLVRPDDFDDPAFVYRRGYSGVVRAARVDGRYPEASSNLQQMLMCARQACLLAALEGSPSSAEEEVLDRLDASCAAYAETLSPPPAAVDGLDLLEDFRATVLDGGTAFASQVRISSEIAADAKWFEGYWKRRGAELAVGEEAVFGSRVVAPEADGDDAAIAMGLGA